MVRIHAFLRVFFVFISLTLSVAVMVPILVLGYWATDRNLPLDHLSGRFDGWDAQEPHTALMTWIGNRDRICPGKIFRWVFADHPYNLQPLDLPPPGAADQLGARGVVFTVRVPIPDEAFRTAKDTLSYHVRLVWQCNPLHQYWPLVLDPPEISIPVPMRTR
jgi:hypothetical protein